MSLRSLLARAALVALIVAPAVAQTAAPQTAATSTKPDQRTLALAAGWKALFLCSGTFLAGMNESDIAANDLEGGYPELQPHIAALPATISNSARTVSVGFDPALAPRVARYSQGQGCTLLPVGADQAKVMPPVEFIGGPDRKRQDARPWPQGDAAATAPLPAARRKAVEAVVAKALSGGRYGSAARTSAVLVILDGKIVAERYARGVGMHTPQRTWSVAKSLTSALVGRGAALGVIDPMAPAHVPEWGPKWGTAGDPRAAITVDQLLRMQSGLFTNGPGNRTDALYFGGGTVAETAATAPIESAPGSRFRYANNDTLLAVKAIDNWLSYYPPSDFLAKIGMHHTVVETDSRGGYILSSQVWTTARDLARFGQLYLEDGKLASGERVLPEGWRGGV
ncbi:MAG: serine hydrolase domain-containing protein, partial [Sandaracinobacter sp.]